MPPPRSAACTDSDTDDGDQEDGVEWEEVEQEAGTRARGGEHGSSRPPPAARAARAATRVTKNSTSRALRDQTNSQVGLAA